MSHVRLQAAIDVGGGCGMVALLEGTNVRVAVLRCDVCEFVLVEVRDAFGVEVYEGVTVL